MCIIKISQNRPGKKAKVEIKQIVKKKIPLLLLHNILLYIQAISKALSSCLGMRVSQQRELSPVYKLHRLERG